MNTRFDICTPRKGRDDKTFWTRIGTAWQSEKGIQLVFDALPIPDSEGRCVANLFEPRQNDGSRGVPMQQAQNRQAYAPALDDEPPFLSADFCMEGRVS